MGEPVEQRAGSRSDLKTVVHSSNGRLLVVRVKGSAEASLILVLSDINMQGMTGLEMLPKVKAMRPDAPVMMIAA